ncbi:MAG: hypothetical protein ACI308_06870 [Muribaculaceae bacterium]
MEFFSSTEFYCMAVVVAIALLGVLLHQSPQGPAETYVLPMLLTGIDGPFGDETLSLTVTPQGEVMLVHTGLMIDPDARVNVTAQKCGDKITIVERRADRVLGSSQPQAMRAVAQLAFVGRGRTWIRFESEVTGTWGTLSLLNVEGYAASVQLRY